LKCEYHPDRTRTNCNTEWWNQESRYCPPGDERITCQLECLTTQNIGNHIKPPPGINALKEYGYNMTTIAEDSYRAFLKNGPTFVSLGKTLEEDALKLDRELTSGRIMFTLPVSISAFSHITEFDKEISGGVDAVAKNQQFPCHTGDWMGSHSQEFLKRFGYHVNGKDLESGMAKELLEVYCKFDFHNCFSPRGPMNGTKMLQHGGNSLAEKGNRAPIRSPFLNTRH